MSAQETLGVVVEFPSRVERGASVCAEGGTVRREPRGLEGMHLTRRGKGLLLAVAMGCALALGIFLGASAVASPVVEGVPVFAHAVMQGETLWDLALELELDRDTREVVTEIMRINGMSDSRLDVGQVLYLPGV